MIRVSDAVIRRHGIIDLPAVDCLIKELSTSR
jgi:hypothetical protein